MNIDKYINLAVRREINRMSLRRRNDSKRLVRDFDLKESLRKAGSFAVKALDFCKRKLNEHPHFKKVIRILLGIIKVIQGIKLGIISTDAARSIIEKKRYEVDKIIDLYEESPGVFSMKQNNTLKILLKALATYLRFIATSIVKRTLTDAGVKGMKKGEHVKARDPEYVESLRGGGRGNRNRGGSLINKSTKEKLKALATGAGVVGAGILGAKLGKRRGFKLGHKEGFKTGETKGFDTGYSKGSTEGRGEGFKRGFTVGREQGQKIGANKAFQEGQRSGYKRGFKYGEEHGTWKNNQKKGFLSRVFNR